MRRHLLLSALAIGLGACGGEPLPGEPLDEVELLVSDDFLARQSCAQMPSLEVLGELSIGGVIGVCRISVDEMGTVLSLCAQVPGRKVRDLTLTYFLETVRGPLRLAEGEVSLDLTAETEERVPLDFSSVDRTMRDQDGDGRSNLEEVCAGTDPRDPAS